MHTLRLINFPLNKELKEIYSFIAIKSLAVSMFGIFLPLYLLIDLSFSLKKVILFFMIAEVVWILFTFIAGKALTKIGAKHSILLGMFLAVLYLMFLVILKEGIITYFYLAAFFHGAASAFYWMGFHTNFVRSSDRQHRGEEASWWKIIPQSTELVGPILGGLILTFFNFESLFILVSIMLIISTLPLFLSREVFKRYHFNYRRLISKDKLKQGIALFGVGIRSRAFVLLWPIFIFLILGSYLSLGSLFSFVTLLGVVFFIFAGRLSDRVDKKILMGVGSIMHAFTWFIRAPIKTALQVFSIASLDIITYALVEVPFDAMSYNRAEKHPIEYFVFRETLIHLGALFLLIFMFFMQDFALAFILTGLANLLPLLF